MYSKTSESQYNVTESVVTASVTTSAKHQTVSAPKHYADPAFRSRWTSEEPPHPMDSLEEWNRSQWEAWKAAQVRASGSYSTGSFAGKAK